MLLSACEYVKALNGVFFAHVTLDMLYYFCSPRFFAALLTAVLTYHLAWVPTVMPVDHPPIKAFSEKRTSQSVNMLAKSHPYNPLWAQLGQYDLESFRFFCRKHLCAFTPFR